MPGGSVRDEARGWVLDGRGGARSILPDAMRQWHPDDGYLWIDWGMDGEAARSWFHDQSGVESASVHQLLESGPWSRVASPDPNSLLVILYLSDKPDGAGHARWSDQVRRPLSGSHDGKDAGADSALRFWIEPHRLISTGVADTIGLSRLQKRFEDHTGPRNPGEILLIATELFASGLADTVLELRARLTDFDLMVEGDEPLPVDKLRRMRRIALEWQRYAEPLRDILIRIRSLDLDWFDTRHHRWSAAIEFFEDGTRALDSVVDHSRALQEFLQHRTSEQVNARLYVLTVLSAVLMPVSVVVDIFGANISTRLGNIMGADGPLWFAAYLALIVATGMLVYFLIRQKLR